MRPPVRKDGWAVVFLCQTHPERAQAITDELRGKGLDVAFRTCDIADSEQVNDTVAAILKDYKHIDALVNCAGIAYRGLLTDMPDATWHHLLATDLDSVFYLQRAVLPGMISRGHGAIVNVSSMWGEVGASCEAAYSAAKAGVIGLTKATAKEVGPSGIRVNCVTPGVIRTPMNAELSDDDWRRWRMKPRWGALASRMNAPKPSCFWHRRKRRLLPGKCWVSAAV